VKDEKLRALVRTMVRKELPLWQRALARRAIWQAGDFLDGPVSANHPLTNDKRVVIKH
jgi:hypothetical protein